MKKYSLINLVTSVMLLLVSFACVQSDFASDDTLPFYDAAEFTPMWIKPGSKELSDFHRIPAFSFINQDGENITEKDFNGKITVANFFFTSCPGICPLIRSKLSKVQSTFSDDDIVGLISHSIRPSNDTVATLKKYAEGNGMLSGKWDLVTGKKEEIYALAKNSYFASEDLGKLQDTKDFLHTENVVLIDQNRHIRGVYNGLNAASVDYLIADIITLKAEMLAPSPKD